MISNSLPLFFLRYFFSIGYTSYLLVSIYPITEAVLLPYPGYSLFTPKIVVLETKQVALLHKPTAIVATKY